MRVSIFFTTMMIAASAQAKTMSVKCETPKDAGDKQSISLSFEITAVGPRNPLHSLEVNGQNLMVFKDGTPDTRRNEGRGLKVDSNGFDWVMNVDVDLDPQYVPYNKSTFKITAAGCETTAGAGMATYSRAEYRMPLRTYNLGCECSSK
jgi:hypothetical protein